MPRASKRRHLAACLLGASVLLFAVAAPVLGASEASWERTLEGAVPAVVALRVTATRTFDTERSGVAHATGFVVDAERGIILTNRHVVHPGPVTAEAVFLNHERVAVHPVYRDPVHDFGFFRYDPAAVRFMEPGAIALAPDRVRVGAEIRVIGNDAGEKLSILAGTLARLDRRAPSYGRQRYNDFNTYYLQAASSTSGGSSGSPVIDITGRAIALNAGGSARSSSSFFLPLDRVVRALERLQADAPITRGTLQTIFVHKPFDELRRLGLRVETERTVRQRRGGDTGLLVVEQVVPGGPGDAALEPGDIVVALDGAPVRGFVGLEARLDDSVGRTVRLEVERGGEPMAFEMEVGDLHAVTPSEYLEWSDAIFHPLSYQQARNRAIPVAGIYVASEGYALGRAGVPRGAVLTAIDGSPIPDLDALERALVALPDGERVTMRWFRIADPRSTTLSVVAVDRRWFPMQRCRRDDAAGSWSCRHAAPPPPPRPLAPATTAFREVGPKPARVLGPSLPFVEFDVPFLLDGTHGRSFSGPGLLVDAERGLVVVDRDTVPVSLGDATLTFARSVRVPGEVVAIHPEHNLSVVRYDPRALGDTPVRSARLELAPLSAGDEIWLVGLNSNQQLLARSTEVARIGERRLPIPRPPRFREANLEVVTVVDPVAVLGGALSDGRGRVRALWSAFSIDDRGKPSALMGGIPAELVAEMVAPLRRGEPFRWRSLGVELSGVSIQDARDRGLGDETVRRLEADDARHRVLEVRRITAGTPAADLLVEGDLLLLVNGAAVTSFRDVERAAQAEDVALRVLRDGAEREVRVATVDLDPIGTSRAVVWAGALLQAPPLAVRAQRASPGDGVYVIGRRHGSPADRDGLLSTRRIVAVNGTPTPDMDRFLAAVSDTPDRGSVRLRVVDLDGRIEVLTLEVDLRYWPTYELARETDGWRRIAR